MAASRAGRMGRDRTAPRALRRGVAISPLPDTSRGGARFPRGGTHGRAGNLVTRAALFLGRYFSTDRGRFSLFLAC